MNSLMKEQGEVLKETQELRRQLLGVLTDADLGFRPAPGCLPLGELCREIGEVQRAYIDSFRTFRHSIGYRHDPGVSRSVAQLATWYAQLDGELQEVLQGLSEEDLGRRIDRGHGFTPPLPVQFHIFREALLIFYAKAHVYLMALGKGVPGAWQWWIGDRAAYDSPSE